jgi:hypothetical protein
VLRRAAALLPIAALLLAPAGATAARRAAPDLVVTKIVIRQLPGDPPYVVEDEAGHTPGFAVRVTTKNIGRAVAKRSRTRLEFSTLGGARVHAATEPVPKLRPSASHVSVFEVDLGAAGRPPLGLLKTAAYADAIGTVNESRESNNRRLAPLLPVIARQWKVLDFMVTEDLSGAAFPGALMTDFTKACWQVDCGRYFVFRFSTFDEAAKTFEYVPEGTVRAGWDYSYPPLQCTGHAAEIRGPKQWPGHLEIDSGLDWYEGLVDVRVAEAPPAHGGIVCPGAPQPVEVEWAFQNLVTYVGERQHAAMPSPSATKLTGHTEGTGMGNAQTTWQWTFQADVPGS